MTVNHRYIAFAASVGAVDFTAAAMMDAMGFDSHSCINTDAPITQNICHIPFDSRAGLPTPRIRRSPDLTFRQVYEPVVDGSLARGLHGVVESILETGAAVNAVEVHRRLRKLIEYVADKDSGIDPRVSVLSAAYKMMGISTSVSTLKSLHQGRVSLGELFRRLDQWLTVPGLDGLYAFIRGGRADVLLADQPGCIACKYVFIEKGKVVDLIGDDVMGTTFRISRDGQSVPSSTTISCEVRLYGPLEVAYLDAEIERLAHLPWHMCGIESSFDVECGLAGEVVSPPGTVCPRRYQLVPSGYLLADYPGESGEYARELLGAEKWPLECIGFITSHVSPLKEKMSRSQKRASGLASRIMSPNWSGALPWPYSELREIWRNAHGELSAIRSQSDRQNWPVRDIYRLGLVFKAVEKLLSSRGLSEIQAGKYRLAELHDSLYRNPGETPAQSHGKVRFAAKSYAEILTSALMLLAETALRADVITLALLGSNKGDLRSVTRARDRAPVRWWSPVLVTPDP